MNSDEQRDLLESLCPDLKNPRHTAFLMALIKSGGNVSRAAIAMGINRWTAYSWRRQCSTFADAWAVAMMVAADLMIDEAFRRAVEGTERVVGVDADGCPITEQRYSDALLMFLIKTRRPEFARGRQQPEPATAVVNSNASYDEMRSDFRKRLVSIIERTKVVEARSGSEGPKRAECGISTEGREYVHS